MKISKELRKYFSRIGKRGGRSRSPAKLAACRRNPKNAGRPRVIKPCGLSARECWRARHKH